MGKNALHCNNVLKNLNSEEEETALKILANTDVVEDNVRVLYIKISYIFIIIISV